MNDHELRELVALAAVDALGDDERAELQAAITDRPDLRAELDSLREAAAAMADAVSDPPPPELRGRVLSAIATTPQLAPEAPVVPITAARGRRRWVAWGAAAAAVVALAVGAIVVVTSDEGGDDQVAAVVDAEDAVEIPMPGELPGVTIVYSASENAAVLLADDVAVPEGDNVYELWAIRDDTPESFATFRPDDDGQLSVYAPGLDPASAQVWAITEEQAGGSPTGLPTSDILAATA
jgi:anti-sigma-K factor RskA